MFDQPTRETPTPASVPEQAPDYGIWMTPATPPKANWKVVVLAVVGLLAAAVLVIGGAFLLGGGKADDVTISDCATSANSAEVTVVVTNSSDSRRSYVIGVDVLWIDQLMGDGFVYVDDVAPGQTVRESGSISVRGKGDECVITSVD